MPLAGLHPLSLFVADRVNCAIMWFSWVPVFDRKVLSAGSAALIDLGVTLITPTTDVFSAQTTKDRAYTSTTANYVVGRQGLVGDASVQLQLDGVQMSLVYN